MRVQAPVEKERVQCKSQTACLLTAGTSWVYVLAQMQVQVAGFVSTEGSTTQRITDLA